MDNLIEKTLKENIRNLNNRFVFPTQMAADLWADRATLTCGVTAVAMERFLAWDDFKGNSIKSKQKDRKSIPSVMRTVFATLLLEENKNNPFIKKLIGPEFSKEAGGFTNWITSLLPSLSLWKKHLAESKAELDDEDKDLLEIFGRYSNFLDANNFFDPAWETPPFQSDGNKYFIFFPEILSDYAEYKEVLETTEDVTIISLPANYLPSIEKTEELPEADFYTDSRSELKNVALKLRKLHKEENISWEEMAISVPDMENYGRYIERELELYRIPNVIRFARPLDSTGAGNFFAQAMECVNSKFTFDSVRDLLLNLELPWKDKESINQLIEFGKENNCICSYSYSGKEIDVWEESFKTDISENRAKEYYKALKKHLTSLVNAKTFAEIREEYFSFRNFAFNMEQCSPSTDRIISRCISELGGLIDIEIAYPQYKLPSPYSFFIQQLSGTKYLEQTDNLGVKVLPYKTAACAPFACHVIIDASQSSLSVIYKPLSFLREDKRKLIFRNQEDPNVTQHFIMLYKMNSHTTEPIFTVASKTFTGYSQACSYLNDHEVDEKELQKSFYDREKEWLSSGSSTAGNSISEFTDISKDGFEFWKQCQNISESKESDSVLKSKIQSIINLKFESETEKGKLKISASSLKKFYNCPRMWVENYLANLDEPVNEATLIDSFAQGSLNHKTLELYFSRLKENNLSVHTTDSGLEGKHLEILTKAVDDAIEMQTKTPTNSGGNSFLATELINATKSVLLENMIAAVDSFSRLFEGFTVLFTEEKLRYESTERNYILEGYVDLVISDGEETFIIDYKKSKTPELLYEDGSIAIKNNDDKKTPLEANSKTKENVPDFQMPAYLFLLEKAKNISAENCAFFSLGSMEIVPVVGEKVFSIFKRLHPKTKVNIYTRETFEPTMKLFHQKTAEYFDRLASKDFKVNDLNQDFDKCNECTFKALCRRTFNVSRKN
ncbi:PD-(D/E)XK nuclease family protein [Treponema sp.]|uniref:PD-(D/E)XK nuclease family protein n=1 Tax=Treponema sp. TaxID=166 RepID=UPI00298DF24A|nr:PD-(D/E)XK nuclease family protein [Treponema sp.]MCQ2240712.1 PD-(D/E)XK nuclease family protein [Treponema sp.]